MMERDFYFLLPDGINTAETMKEGCEKMSIKAGHPIYSSTFRNLMHKGVIKKMNKITHSIMTDCDAKETTLPTCQL
jgi:hypothetical protein